MQDAQIKWRSRAVGFPNLLGYLAVNVSGNIRYKNVKIGCMAICGGARASLRAKRAKHAPDRLCLKSPLRRYYADCLAPPQSGGMFIETHRPHSLFPNCAKCRAFCAIRKTIKMNHETINIPCLRHGRNPQTREPQSITFEAKPSGHGSRCALMRAGMSALHLGAFYTAIIKLI